MVKNWQNSGFVTKFLMKCAYFDEQKMAFLVAKFFEAWLCIICLCSCVFTGVDMKAAPDDGRYIGFVDTAD